MAALQEVDVSVERSGNVNTVYDVAHAWSGSFTACANSLRRDGTLQCESNGVTVLFGTGFHGNDAFHNDAQGLPSGIIDADDTLNPRGIDRKEHALYGNALIVLPPFTVLAAYTLALPERTGEPLPSELMEVLSTHATLSDEVLEALGEHNDGVRNRPGIEPRCALVARVGEEGAAPVTVITTHLESQGGDDLRQTQLEALTAVAGAERQGGQTRGVVVLGDFNMLPERSTPALTDAGFVQADAGMPSIDQLWVSSELRTTDITAPATEGVSDHRFSIGVTVH